MPEQLTAELDLDYGAAISGADALGAAIEESMSAGAAAGASAVSDAIDGLTASAIEVPVEADVSTAQGEIDGLTGQPVEVPVDADVAPAQGEIAGISADPVTIDVEADTSAADTEISALGDTASGASESLSGLGSSSSQASGGISEAGIAAGAAGGTIAGVGGSAIGAAAGVAGLGLSFKELFDAGVTAATGTERLKQAAGDLASQIEHVQVGNLNTSLAELGHQFGSTGAEMDSAAAKAFQFATAGGFSAQKSAQFADGIAALAARAVALNPSLGNVADVADQMSTSFGRVLLAAKKYNLALSSTEVAQRAMADTGKTATNQLTVQEKAVAAVEVATAKYGDTLAQKIAAGSELAANKQKSLIATAKDVAETLGRPLAEGTIAGLTQLQGPVESLLHGFQALPGPIQTTTVALLALGVAGKLLGVSAEAASGFVGRLAFGLAGAEGGFSAILPAAAIAGAAIGTMGVVSGNTTQAVLGFAASGAALGTIILPGIGTAVGAAAGALVGLGAAFHSGSMSSDALEQAQHRLNSAVTSGSVPAIVVATDAVLKITSASKIWKDTTDALGGSASKLPGQFREVGGSAVQASGDMERSKALTEGFNTALAKSPAAALQTIDAYDKLGISTQLYADKLNVSVQSSQLAAQAQAQVASAAAPLKVTFEQASTAVGGLTERQFEVAGAASQALDSMSKLGDTTLKFAAAVKSGDAAQIEAATNAVASATAQDAYNQKLLETGSATQAATTASGVFRDQLGQMLTSIPEDNPAHAAIQKIIDEMDNLTAHPATIDLKVDGGSAALQLASINRAIDDIIKHPQQNPVKIFMDDTEATAKLDGINQARQILTRDPTQFQVVMQDLATGNLDHLNQLLAGIPPVKDTKVNAQTDEARTNVTQLANEIDNTHGTVKVGGDATGAHASTQEAKVSVDATTGRIKIDGDPSLAQGAVVGAKVYADATTGKITIGGDNAPANSVIVGTVNTANGSTGTITVGGNPGPAHEAVTHAVGDANSSHGEIGIGGHETFLRGDYGTIGTATIAVHEQLFPALFASGGTVPFGGAAVSGLSLGNDSLVQMNERGGELAILPGGTRILNNPQTRGVMQRVGSQSRGDVYISVDARGADREAVTALKRLDWRHIGDTLDSERSRRSFLGGRHS